MAGKRILNLIAQHRTAAVTMIIGLIAGPIVGVMLIDYISITPNRLIRHLEAGDVSTFNDDRRQVKRQIVFEGINLSNENLTGVEVL
jgi:hypothetical protein